MRVGELGWAVVVGLGLSGSAWTGSPAPISPGGLGVGGTVTQSCPTFSWEASADAEWVELVVYSLPDGATPVSGTSEPLLELQLPGGATSWTPSLGRCLDRGGQYAWSVRAVDHDRQGNWAAPALFGVAAQPSIEEVEQALQVLRDYRSSVEAEPVPESRSVPLPVEPAPLALPPAKAPDRPAGVEESAMTVDGVLEGGTVRLGDTGGNFIFWDMFEDAGNDMIIDYAGEKVRITLTGNVGIGTGSSVPHPLVVDGTAQADTVRLGDTGGNSIFWDISENAGNAMTFVYGANERFRVSAGGIARVGALGTGGTTSVCRNANGDLSTCDGAQASEGILARQGERIERLEAALCAQGVSASFCSGTSR